MLHLACSLSGSICFVQQPHKGYVVRKLVACCFFAVHIVDIPHAKSQERGSIKDLPNEKTTIDRTYHAQVRVKYHILYYFKMVQVLSDADSRIHPVVACGL